MTDFHYLLNRLDNSISVELIAQRVEVWGDSLSLEDVIAKADRRKFDTAFIGRRRSDGISVWVDKVVEVGEKNIRDLLQRDLVSGDLPLSSATRLLVKRPFALVLTGDRVTAVVTRADLNSLPVRIMLFAVMTHAEMLLADAILRQYRGDTWIDELSAPKQVTIRELQQKKVEVDADTRLLDCATLGMKCDVASRTPALVKLLGYPSRTQFQKDRFRFERLRNRLLHNQDLPDTETSTLSAPEDNLRDALAHGDRLIVSGDAVKTLHEVVATIHRWIEGLSKG